MTIMPLRSILIHQSAKIAILFAAITFHSAAQAQEISPGTIIPDDVKNIGDWNVTGEGMWRYYRDGQIQWRGPPICCYSIFKRQNEWTVAITERYLDDPITSDRRFRIVQTFIYRTGPSETDQACNATLMAWGRGPGHPTNNLYYDGQSFVVENSDWQEETCWSGE